MLSRINSVSTGTCGQGRSKYLKGVGTWDAKWSNSQIPTLPLLSLSSPSSIELNEPPLVHTAASLFKEMCYRYREDLMAGIIIAGWDPQEGGQVRHPQPPSEPWSHAFGPVPTAAIFCLSS